MNADVDKTTRANDISAELIIDTDAGEANSVYNSTNESKGSHEWIVFIKQDRNLRVRSVAKKEESELRASELLVWYVRILSMKIVYSALGGHNFDDEQKGLRLTGPQSLEREFESKALVMPLSSFLACYRLIFAKKAAELLLTRGVPLGFATRYGIEIDQKPVRA